MIDDMSHDRRLEATQFIGCQNGYRLSKETRNRLQQLEAHMDEGGKTDNSIVYELLGYIKELSK